MKIISNDEQISGDYWNNRVSELLEVLVVMKMKTAKEMRYTDVLREKTERKAM